MSDLILSPNISPLIKSQFPRYYNEEGPRFIEFIEAYYEWLEQEGMSVSQARQLFELRDIDTTTQIDHFTRKYLNGFPVYLLYDKKFLIKHVLDIYRSKGSTTGYKLLFKLLYNDDIEIYLPSSDIFAASDGTWYEPKYLELAESSYSNGLVGSIIKGRSSRAEAVVESVVQQPVNGKIVNIAYLSNISGSFVYGERIVSEDQDLEVDYILNAPKVLGSLNSLQVVQGGQQFKVGDTLIAVSGRGTEAEARVSRVANGTGTLAFSVGNGGLLYSMDAIEVITRDPSDTTGRGASFDVGSITSVESVTYDTDLIFEYQANNMGGEVNNIRVANSGSGYTNGQLLVFTPRYHIADVTPKVPGVQYANGDIIRMSGPSAIVNGYCTVTTNEKGHMLAVDILNPGVFTSNATPTLTLQTQNGGNGATYTIVMDNPGSNAQGYIVTNNSGNITEARINVANGLTYKGQNFNAPPIISVANTTGTGASFVANVAVDLGFDANTATTMYMPLTEVLNYETKNFGSIGSLTNIATGNNYTAEPSVVVRDLITTKHAQPGQVYYANTSKQLTGVGTKFMDNYVPGDFITLVADPGTNSKVDIRIIASIANNTSLTLDDRALYTSNGVIDRIFVTNGGTGYQNTNTVTIGGPGTGANVNIVTDIGGAIIRANVLRGGSGYYTLPNITLNSNTGSGATLSAQVTNAVYKYSTPVFPADFHLSDLGSRLTANGSYPGTNEIINAPPVFGVGIIRDVQIKNSGFGYEDGEFIRFATFGAVNPIIIVEGGSGYANNDTLIFAGGGPLTTARGVVSTDDDGVIKFVALTDVGSGYKFIPEVRIISKKGTGAELRATIGGLNTKYNVSGYAGIDGIGRTKGSFTTTKGFTSSNKYIQDSYYYQEYSYEIQSSLTLTQFEGTVKPLFHPSGTEMFGRVVKTDELVVSSSIEYDSIVSILGSPEPDGSDVNVAGSLNYSRPENTILKFVLGM